MASSNDAWGVIFVAVFFSLVRGCSSADICNINGNLKTCEAGCCTNDCCNDFGTEQIVGIVIGGIMALVFLGSCIACIVLACKKKKQPHQHNGEVRPYGQQPMNSVYIHNGGYGGYGGYGGGQYGQQYGQQYGHPPPRGGANPPSYTQASAYPQDPAYPPGQVGEHPPPYTFNDGASSLATTSKKK